MATIEESILSAAPEAEQPITEEPAMEENPAPKSTKTKKSAIAKESKAKKVPAPRNRNKPAHPTYFEMVKDAIVTLKERTGSSQYAITKFIEDKQKNLPPNFRKLLLVQLKKLVANDKLVKVKSSYKLPSARSSKPVVVSLPAKKNTAPAAKSKAKPKAAAAATKEKKAVDSKPKPKAKAAAVKSKAAVTAKAKPAAKAKAKPVEKLKAAIPVKAKASLKRKAPEKPKAEKKTLAKAARTSTRSTPRRGAVDVVLAAAVAELRAKKASVAKKAVPVKSVKKTVKSPAKKSTTRKGGKK